MSNANVQFIGADNLAATTLDQQRALYLKLFAGETITAFEETTIFKDKHQVKTITSGKSAQFPVFGRMPDAEYHTPGTEIVGMNVPMSEVTLTVDKLLIDHIFLADIDEAIAHYEARSKYSHMMGMKLSTTYDHHIGRELVRAAATPSPIAGDTTRGGTIITDAGLVAATADAKLQAWKDTLFLAAETFQRKYVPGPYYCVMDPADYNFLVKTAETSGFSPIHRDYGGNGSIADGTIYNLAGIKLLSFPNLPTGDYRTQEFHNVDCRNTRGIVFTADAVGTVKLMDLSLQAQWDIRRQGTLMVARYAMGHGPLRGECAIQLRNAVPLP